MFAGSSAHAALAVAELRFGALHPLIGQSRETRPPNRRIQQAAELFSLSRYPWQKAGVEDPPRCICCAFSRSGQWWLHVSPKIHRDSRSVLSLRHIEVFYAVYTAGSVSGAARTLNCSQPSVTKVLQHAEQAFGFALFNRARGRLVATEYAHTLFTTVADIQAQVESLRQASFNLKQGRDGSLSISTVPSLGLEAIPASVAAFLETHEDVFFDLQTVHHDEMVRKLVERETELVIGYAVPATASLASHWLAEGELVVLYREADMPAAPARLPLSCLAGKPFVSLIQSGPIGQLLSSELARCGLVLHEAVSARTFYIAAGLVRAGVGMTVVDNFTAAANRAPGISFRPLQPALAFDVHAIHLENRQLSPLALRFLDLLKTTIEAM
jgi:DNA-binding transcriptional LysR family regulator